MTRPTGFELAAVSRREASLLMSKRSGQEPRARSGLSWRALPLPGRPPLTRFAYWVSSQECTIRIEKARTELGYEPIRTIDDGLRELRAGAE